MPSGKLGDVQPTQVALAMHQLTPPFHFRVAESQPLHGPGSRVRTGTPSCPS